MHKILHITNWYPSKPTPRQAQFVKNQIDALGLSSIQTVWHIQISKGKLDLKFGSNSNDSRYIILYLPIEIWRINELISFCLVCIALFKERKTKFDIINFHVAYPNCTYIHILKRMLKCPIAITEHWSAYHFNFNVKNKNKLSRIIRIFHHDIPIIGVSKAIINDIKKFSNADFPSFIIPNVVKTNIFRHYSIPSRKKGQPYPRLFMISQWKWPKDPFAVIKMIPVLKERYPNVQLRVGGYGPQWNDMIRLVKDLCIESRVDFLGHLKSEEIAYELNMAHAFIHSSEYETFSVVCAEAICCGCPVITRPVGGIMEFINETNGVFAGVNQIHLAIGKILDGIDIYYVRKQISAQSSNMFSVQSVGQAYNKVLSKIRCS